MASEVRTTTKKELVHRIADETGQTKVVVKEIVQRFLDEIVQELALGHRLEFREFGVFEVKERAARRAQNPRTLEKVEVPAKRVVKFKVGRTMRQRVCDEPAPRPAPEPPTPPRDDHGRDDHGRDDRRPPLPPRKSNSPF